MSHTLPPETLKKLFAKDTPLREARTLARSVAAELLGEEARLRRDPVPLRSDNLTGAVTWEYRAQTGEDGAQSRDRFIIATTSSTDRDLYRTRMARSAIVAMQRSAKDNMTIFLNHVYTVPESVLGSVSDAPMVERTDPKTGERYLDLDLAVKCLPEGVNPRVDQSWKTLEAGTKLGFSIGALILDWEIQTKDGTPVSEEDDPDADPYEVLYGPNEKDYYFTITDVLLVESSLVGVPANRRSWVAETRRALLRSGEMPQRAGIPAAAALRAAPPDARPAPAVAPVRLVAEGDRSEDSATGFVIEHGADPEDDGRSLAELEGEFLGTFAQPAGAAAAGAAPRSEALAAAMRAQTTTGTAPTPTRAPAAGRSWGRADEEEAAAGAAPSGDAGDLDEDEDEDGEEDLRSLEALEALAYGPRPAAQAAAPTPVTACAPPPPPPAEGATGAAPAAAPVPAVPEDSRAVRLLQSRLDYIAANLAAMAARGFTSEQRDALELAHDHAAHTLGMQCCGLEGCSGHPASHDMTRRGLGEAAVHLTRSHDHIARALQLDCMAFGADDGDGNDAPDADDDDAQEAAAAKGRGKGKGGSKKDAAETAIVARLATPFGELTLSAEADVAAVLYSFLAARDVEVEAPVAITVLAGATPAAEGLSPAEVASLRALLAQVTAAEAGMQRKLEMATALQANIISEITRLGAQERAALEHLQEIHEFVRLVDDVGLYRPTNRRALSATDANAAARRLAARPSEGGAGTGYLALELDALTRAAQRADADADPDPDAAGATSLIEMSDEEFYAAYGVADLA